jgi:hypothetical protein
LGGIAGLVIGLGALTIPGLGPVIAAGPLASALIGAGLGAVAGGVLGALVGWGIPEEHAEYYAEGVRRGGTLVAVKADESQVNDVSDIMRRYGPVDLEERSSEWRDTGWSGFDMPDDDYVYYEPRYRRHYRTSYASTGNDFDYYSPAYRFGYDLAHNPDYEDYEWDEVEAEAHQTWDDKFEGAWDDFKDTVRHAWQEVKDVFDVDDTHYYDTTYRSHYEQNYANTDQPYDYYVPAYKYGYSLHDDDDFYGRSWTDVEPEVRSEWESEYDSVWDDIKDAVRHAWEETQDTLDVDDWYEENESDFRRHYYTYYSYGPYPYSRYIPAYRYGYELANDSRYADREWDAIAADAANDWGNESDGAWDDFKDAVRHGWESFKGGVRETADDIEDAFDGDDDY